VTFPLSTLLFTCGIPWPLLGSNVQLNGWILTGLFVEVTGIMWYYSEKKKKASIISADHNYNETSLLLDNQK